MSSAIATAKRKAKNMGLISNADGDLAKSLVMPPTARDETSLNSCVTVKFAEFGLSSERSTEC
eukprot:722378-Prorocentrum_minimum.AAC.1